MKKQITIKQGDSKVDFKKIKDITSVNIEKDNLIINLEVRE